MASMAVEVITRTAPAVVWDGIRDIGALHTRLVPGFVVATEIVPGDADARSSHAQYPQGFGNAWDLQTLTKFPAPD